MKKVSLKRWPLMYNITTQPELNLSDRTSIAFHSLSNQIKQAIQNKFGDRARFDPYERLLYSHDLASPPPLLKPLISRRQASGIIQPQDESEVIWLLELAEAHGIPLTPRGRGTSGYGGAMPVSGGLVVDFSRMRKIIRIDPVNLTATVEPGVVWLDLERALTPHGLSLRLYPGSSPSSTVGGWMAQGGSGFGSYAYGWFSDNVTTARIVLPSGQVTTCAGAELEMINDAEGITGFITEITIQVKPLEAMEIVGVAFKFAARMSGLFNWLYLQGVNIWSASFFNPYMLELKTKLSPGEDVIPPGAEGSYLALLVFPAADHAAKSGIESAVRSCGGVLMEPEFSERLWRERFNILKIKKLAPSFISTKVAVPLASLEDALANCRKLRQPVALEGVLLRGKNQPPQAILLGFILHHERKMSYNPAYSQSLSFIKLAMQAGGQPCSTGIYFKFRAAEILGHERLRRLAAIKKAVDPRGILNPGKVIGKDWLNRLMGLALTCDPLVRSAANLVPVWKAADAVEVHDPKDIAWHALSCDQCGFCLAACPQFAGWESESLRGMWYLVRSRGLTVSPCRKCEVCRVVCPQNLPPITKT